MDVAVSGGFDPVHQGHLSLFRQARSLGDSLTVVLNNDNWLEAKKDYCFMSEDHRKTIVSSIECVDRVVMTEHRHSPKDMSCLSGLIKASPDIFANGGDRKTGNVPEYQYCNERNIILAFNVGDEKIYSSSELVEDAAESL